MSIPLFLLGLGHLGLLAIRKAELPPNHALKTWGGTLLSFALFGGGIVPDEDVAELRQLGFRAIFTPGTTTTEVVEFVKAACAGRQDGTS